MRLAPSDRPTADRAGDQVRRLSRCAIAAGGRGPGRQRLAVSWVLLVVVWGGNLAAQPPGGDPPAAAGAAATNAASPSSPPKSVTPWEYAPYRIQVWVAAASSAELNAAMVDRLRGELQRMGESLPDAPWFWTVSPPPAALESTVAYAPEQLTDAEIARAAAPALKDDKIIWVSLQATPREIAIRTRELDCHARIWSRVESRSMRQPDALGSGVFDAILAVFAPLARIEEGQGKSCICRTRAGGLVLTPESPAYIGKGDVLQPIFRQNDRYGDPLPNRVQALPFTLLQVVSQDAESGSLLNCNVHSGMRSPIHGRGSARRERWALKVRPALEATQLVVTSRPLTRGERGVPLAGLEVYAKTPPLEPVPAETEKDRAEAEKRNPPELLGVTDWRGSLTMPRSKELLKLVYIKNGGLLLARLPMVLGAEPHLTAEVADDNPRLQAEGFVKGMTSEITDLVVQRQLLRIRFRKRLEDGKLDEAQQLLDEFRGLKSLNDLLRMLDQQMDRQKPSAHPAVKQRIDQLYADERSMIAKYVDVEMLNQLQRELAAARANPNAVPKPAVPAAADGAQPPEKKKELPPALRNAKGGNANGGAASGAP